MLSGSQVGVARDYPPRFQVHQLSTVSATVGRVEWKMVWSIRGRSGIQETIEQRYSQERIRSVPLVYDEQETGGQNGATATLGAARTTFLLVWRQR
jgi:hypothetical protein